MSSSRRSPRAQSPPDSEMESAQTISKTNQTTLAAFGTTHTPSHTTAPMTAAQRGFNAPELMSKILEQFVGEQREAKPGNPLGFSDLKSFQRCSLVN
ncbi:hypothetical protein PoHVEF18_006463 [Penicillium ochrochloron]